MAEMLATANAAYDEWLHQQHDLDKLDRVLLYMAFLNGFKAGTEYADAPDPRETKG